MSIDIAVVGCVLGILVLIGFIVAMAMLFRRSKYQKSKRHQTSSDNVYSGSTDDDRPWHEYETVPKSQPLNNTKNNRTTAKNTLVTTNPAFDGELTQSAAQKDMLDGNAHRGGSDNATGHVYNYIDCSKVDPQSGFVVNDLYRPCSFVTDSAAVTSSSKYQWQRDVRKPKDVTSFDSKTQAVGEDGVGFKDNDIYEGGDTDGNTKDHNEYADLQGDTSGFVDNVLYEHGDEAPSGSERRQHVHDISGDDKADGNGDGVYYSTIGHGDTAGILKDNISYEPATFQQS
ncbi:uncharacterized protein [Ptychodera flava]|uniref:uncharacterized protein n=1 Tax=Ptychodera flava TaxID=63121 RepID=UPI003969FC48